MRILGLINFECTLAIHLTTAKIKPVLKQENVPWKISLLIDYKNSTDLLIDKLNYHFLSSPIKIFHKICAECISMENFTLQINFILEI